MIDNNLRLQQRLSSQRPCGLPGIRRYGVGGGSASEYSETALSPIREPQTSKPPFLYTSKAAKWAVHPQRKTNSCHTAVSKGTVNAISVCQGSCSIAPMGALGCGGTLPQLRRIKGREADLFLAFPLVVVCDLKK